jgi:hypothetical protein
MKVLPKLQQKRKDDLTPMQRLSKRLALALALVGVFVFFVKIGTGYIIYDS